MAVISYGVFVPKIYSFVEIVSSDDPIPHFVENNLAQLEGMSSGVVSSGWSSDGEGRPPLLKRRLDLSQEELTWGTNRYPTILAPRPGIILV